MVDGDTNTWSPEDTLRVLIASDIHLGHLENDAVRGEDSFIAFEEVLSMAVQYDADMILLGGDLFDHAKPSPSCMYKCTEIMRKYCLGDKPVHVELLSDQLENFSRNVNYEDPNLNVSYPILSIHGNHDDPVGQGSISSLDILSISGLVNYFGKWTDYTHVRISPVLMQKGATRLALYGLSHLKDQRLTRLFAEQKVEMERPDETLDWFNLLVLHQNRADRGPGNYIREDVLPKFLDLVVWGHEHDSQMFPMQGKKAEKDSFTVLQPGSTVATSLAAGEALPKHCALLQIHRGDFTVTPLPLKTVRPFIFKTIVLSEENLGEEAVNEAEKVQEFLKSRVTEAIEEARGQRSGDPRQPELPLVRLNVFYDREAQNFNRARFGQHFGGLVANPGDVLNMKREKKVRARAERAAAGEEADLRGVAAQAADVEALLRAYFLAQPPERRLAVLSVRLVTEAVRDFTIKHSDDVFRRTFDAHRRRFVSALLDAGPDEAEEVAARVAACKAELDAAEDERLAALVDTSVRAAPPKLVVPIVKLPPQVTVKRVASPAARKPIVVLSSDEEDREPLRGAARGRGRGARGAATPRARGRGRRSAAREPSPSPPPPPPETRRTPRRAAAQKSSSWLQNIVNSRRSNNSDIEDSD